MRTKSDGWNLLLVSLTAILVPAGVALRDAPWGAWCGVPTSLGVLIIAGVWFTIWALRLIWKGDDDPIEVEARKKKQMDAWRKWACDQLVALQNDLARATTPGGGGRHGGARMPVSSESAVSSVASSAEWILPGIGVKDRVENAYTNLSEDERKNVPSDGNNQRAFCAKREIGQLITEVREGRHDNLGHAGSIASTA